MYSKASKESYILFLTPEVRRVSRYAFHCAAGSGFGPAHHHARFAVSFRCYAQSGDSPIGLRANTAISEDKCTKYLQLPATAGGALAVRRAGSGVDRYGAGHFVFNPRYAFAERQQLA